MNFLPEKIASINKSIYPFGYTLGMKGLNVNVIKILMCPLQKEHRHGSTITWKMHYGSLKKSLERIKTGCKD